MSTSFPALTSSLAVHQHPSNILDFLNAHDLQNIVLDNDNAEFYNNDMSFKYFNSYYLCMSHTMSEGRWVKANS